MSAEVLRFPTATSDMLSDSLNVAATAWTVLLGALARQAARTAAPSSEAESAIAPIGQGAAAQLRRENYLNLRSVEP